MEAVHVMQKLVRHSRRKLLEHILLAVARFTTVDVTHVVRHLILNLTRDVLGPCSIPNQGLSGYTLETLIFSEKHAKKLVVLHMIHKTRHT